MSYTISEKAKRNFILQLGFPEPEGGTCDEQFSALQFQPRVVGLSVLMGILVQSPTVFLALAAALLLSGFRPKWNPFDALYNATLRWRRATLKLTPAPAPRQFAAAEAGSVALIIAISLLQHWMNTAFVLEAILLMAAGAVVFAKFCTGSVTYHLIRGNFTFLKNTLPWRYCKQPLQSQGCL